MSQAAFHNKWKDMKTDSKQKDEKILYVEKGEIPRTQRQISLYNYYRFIEKYLKEIDAKNVLEVGCGRGTTSLFIASYLGLNVTLLDNEEDAIAVARAAFAERGLDATFIVGDAFNITEVPAGSQDAVVSIGLAEHVDNVDELFAEQFRLLRPGGVMISLNIPKKRSVQDLNLIWRFLLKITGQYKEKLGKDYYRNTLTAKEYDDAAKSVGFVQTEVMHVCPFPIYVPLSLYWDKWVAFFRRCILAVRSIFMSYPYKTNRWIAHAHFLVGRKPL